MQQEPSDSGFVFAVGLDGVILGEVFSPCFNSISNANNNLIFVAELIQ